jgi:1-acylglycerone phosphate reductase
VLAPSLTLARLAVYEAPALEADPVRIRQMYDTNVFGLFDVVAAFTPLLIAAVPNTDHIPTIVNVASILARVPFPFASAYNASKAAVSVYSDTLRLELSPLGVRVVTLFMGEVSTGLMSADNISFGPDSLYADLEAKVKERTLEHAKTSIRPHPFAQQVVDSVLKQKTSYVWKGTGAFLIWLLNAFGPRKVFDSTMKSSVGLDQKELCKNIYERGQKLVSGQ